MEEILIVLVHDIQLVSYPRSMGAFYEFPFRLLVIQRFVGLFHAELFAESRGSTGIMGLDCFQIKGRKTCETLRE